jgi:hypothetical protein
MFRSLTLSRRSLDTVNAWLARLLYIEQRHYRYFQPKVVSSSTQFLVLLFGSTIANGCAKSAVVLPARRKFSLFLLSVLHSAVEHCTVCWTLEIHGSVPVISSVVRNFSIGVQ